jgi:subtilase family serine protease
MKRLASFVATISLATAVSTTTVVNAAPGHSPIALHDRGSANPAERINITVHLKLPNEGLFTKTVDALYDPASPRFHQWLTDAQLKAFAPAPAEVAVVRAELERNGLTIGSLSKDGFSLRAAGTIGQVGRAFHTAIHVFDANGRTFRANTNTAKLGGLAGSYVAAVSGLESHTVRPMLSRAINLKTKQPFPSVALSRVEAAGGFSSIITDKILGPAQTVAFKTPGAALPVATYTDVLYDPVASLFPDYTPKELESAYDLEPAYKAGLDGTGQTIVLLEAYGYPTIESDANALFKLAGLPALTSSNFKIVYPDGKPADPGAGILEGWNIEIALDVQWAHTIAPGAKIVVVASNGQDSEDFQSAMQYIIDNKVGYAVSDSWGEDIDLLSGPAEQESFERVLVKAAAKGISFQFSSGDSGDGGLGTPIGAPLVPAVEPHATAVGGTSIFNNPTGSGTQAAGWGDTFDYLDLFGPTDPPTEDAFFYAGAGGGESVFWGKPAWQASLPGRGRQTPDVSALADPYTGVPIVVYDPTLKEQDQEAGWGGTSLASPIFTAFWAIAQQKAGHPLGQASPTIAALKSGIVDVVPFSKPDDLHGSVTDSHGTTDYSADALFASALPAKLNVFAALWNQPQYEDALAYGIGLDSSLTVTKGWDNVTGYGTPAGLGFIEAAAAYR